MAPHITPHITPQTMRRGQIGQAHENLAWLAAKFRAIPDVVEDTFAQGDFVRNQVTCFPHGCDASTSTYNICPPPMSRGSIDEIIRTLLPRGQEKGKEDNHLVSQPATRGPRKGLESWAKENLNGRATQQHSRVRATVQEAPSAPIQGEAALAELSTLPAPAQGEEAPVEPEEGVKAQDNPGSRRPLVYIPLDDVEAFMNGLRDGFQMPGRTVSLQTPVRSKSLFELYLRASAQERVSQAIQILAAGIFVELYPTRQLRTCDFGSGAFASALAKRTIQNHFRTFKNLGRAYGRLAQEFGAAALLLLHKAERCAWPATNMNGHSIENSISGLVDFSTALRALSGRWRPRAVFAMPANSHQIAVQLGLEGPDGDSAVLLLVLLMFICDSFVPTSIIEQATTPRVRWSSEGEHMSLIAIEAGVHGDLADKLFKPGCVARSLELLIANSLLQPDKIVLSNWKPINPESPSTIERHVLGLVLSKLGMVCRFQGRFSDALTTLQQVVCSQSGLISLSDTTSELADVLTELDRPDEAISTIDKEQEACAGNAESNTAEQRRLQLSLAEAFMRKGLLQDAASIYRASNQGGSFAELRTTIGLARIAHLQSDWDGAFEHWNCALKRISGDFPRGDTHSGHTYLAVLESTYHVLLMRGEHKYAAQTLANITQIRETSDSRGCTNWIPGLSNHWLRYLHKQIPRARL
ncbi:TPR repeat [Teratosphaeria destructans]|uniref:TPR repeat n=1 Tax=Teratosphaeria destructans TaxID=418781 RepID=A0A9W7SRI5_9PEZI|nr:TPR repeat [Teratosphaeria destructans]